MLCTNCGRKFLPSEAFCIDCGAAVEGSGSKSASTKEQSEASHNSGSKSPFMCFFSEADVSFPEERRPQTSEICLVLTNTELLRRQLSESFEDLESCIRLLVNSSFQQETRYLLLDLADTNLGLLGGSHDWREVVEILGRAAEKIKSRLAQPLQSIFIIGDQTIVPMALHGNPLGRDVDVESDYCYSCLSADDPWQNLVEPILAVGRLPAGETSGAELALSYFRLRLALAHPTKSAHDSFGVGAEKWSGASKAAFGLFNGRSLHFAPPVSSEKVHKKIGPEVDLLYFNLHGSDERDVAGWYGESKGGEYVEALTPASLGSLAVANVVGVEACYGAKFCNLPRETSCLLSALSNKTIAFMGASRIAYGPPEPPIGLADIMVGHFLANIANGNTAGEAHRTARLDLFEQAGDDGHARLTVLEFNLFGDPTYRAFVPGAGFEKTIDSNAAPKPKVASTLSPAAQLRQSIQNSAAASRSQMSKSIRRVDLATEISEEVRRNLTQCSRVAFQYLQTNFPEFSTCEVSTALLQIANSKKVIQNYSLPGPTRGLAKGLSLCQDFSKGDIEAVFSTK